MNDTAYDHDLWTVRDPHAPVLRYRMALLHLQTVQIRQQPGQEHRILLRRAVGICLRNDQQGDQQRCELCLSVLHPGLRVGIPGHGHVLQERAQTERMTRIGMEILDTVYVWM